VLLDSTIEDSVEEEDPEELLELLELLACLLASMVSY